MPQLPIRRQQPNPVTPQVPIPSEFPAIPDEVLERFPSAKDWQTRLNEFWGRTSQALQESQRQTASQVNSQVIWTVDRFLIYTNNGGTMPMFALDDTGIRLGNVLVINTPGRKVYIGAGQYANDNTPFYIDTLGRFSLGASLTWNPDTDTLTITGIINATSGTIGGFDIGADYIRDTINSFGMASTVTGGDDVRFWAGDTFANRATAVLRITESGVLTGREVHLSDVAGTDNRRIYFDTGTSNRWAIFVVGTAETGANAGSNFAISSYTDAGAYMGDIFVATRSTRAMQFNENLLTLRWNSIGVTSTVKLDIQNASSATSILNQWSPAISFKGDGWKTDAGGGRVNCNWRVEVRPVTGAAAPYNPLVFSSDVSDTPTFVARVTFDSTGINSTNIGATTPGTGAFTDLSAISTTFISLTRSTSETVVVRNSMVLKHLTSGNMADGFGTRLSFNIADSGADNTVVTLDAVRNGSDSLADLVISTSAEALRITAGAGVKVASLAGVGSRTVVADANGVLSAP